MSDKTIDPAIFAGSAIAGVQTAPNLTDSGCYAYKDFLHPFTQTFSSSAGATRSLPATRGFLVRNRSYPPKRNFPGKQPRIGVFVCSCGVNIAGVVDVDLVAAYAKTLAHVTWVENHLFTCADDTRNLIARRIGENNLNRIIIAACALTIREPLFQEMLREAGLNAHLVEMADIRNQNAQVHQKEPEEATEMVMDQVSMAVQKAIRNAPLERRII